MKRLDNTELKIVYWAHQDCSPEEIDYLVKKYADKPATSGEAVFAIRYHIKYLLSSVPVINKFFKLDKLC